ncbi:S24/S26 family peptidase [Methanobacterium sp.]|uniref:S24/S26 family peptidase n=1 Tax=Methanobacterium sp. TaxID=2164 RepID=UPI003158E36C
MKVRSWFVIGIIILGVMATSACIAPSNNIGITIDTNGTNVTVKSTTFLSNPPSQMMSEMEQQALTDIESSNSTVESVKSDMQSVAKKYNYTVNVTIKSQFGTDQLPMPAQVSGTSMVPTLQDGQSIVVLKTKDFKVNDIVVAVHPDYGLIVKRVGQISGDQVYLISDNKNIETTTVKLSNGAVETITKTPYKGWLPKKNVIGVVKEY